MTSPLQPPTRMRVSDAERDETIRVLRDSAAMGRLSPDTFIHRMELALRAGVRHQLDALVDDLPIDQRLARVRCWMSDKMRRVELRLRRQQVGQPLLLPAPGVLQVRIGRDPRCGLRLSDATVSRTHAELFTVGGIWMVRDLGSMNGTFVNGRRVAGIAMVRVGDQLRFGRPMFQLVDR